MNDRWNCGEGRSVVRRAVTAEAGCDDLIHEDDGSVCRHIKAPAPSGDACEEGTCWSGPLGEACDHWQAKVERLRVENLMLVDAMRDARALLHKPRPRAMAAAVMLGSALEARMLAMLPEEGDDDGAEITRMRDENEEAKRLLRRWIAAFYKGDEEVCHDTLVLLGEADA